MSFESLINLRHCRVTRKTDVILEKIQITAAPVDFRQPPRAACLHVEISGCSDGTGEVTIHGVPNSEVFDFSENGIVEGIKEFTEVTSIATLGFISEATVGEITIRAATPTGQPIYQEIPIFAEMPCWVDVRRGGIVIAVPGGVVTQVTKLFTKYNSSKPLKENDIIYYRDRRYRVDFIEETFSKSQTPHHLELILKQIKANEG
ncbi:unnamed protein product [marine sediment metagenome]|uniref:Uncharacterized protein n=1 Tax=marine sediment metagenome TaxID=412755 RepID=X1RVF1_9ZZZZ